MEEIFNNFFQQSQPRKVVLKWLQSAICPLNDKSLKPFSAFLHHFVLLKLAFLGDLLLR